jgi:hypothetical protein
MSNGGPGTQWGPGGGPASPAQLIGNNIDKKAKNQALRNVYEKATGKSAAPGHGPANLIRSFAGITSPKGAEGGKRKTRRLHKKSKKTRGRR